MENFKEFTLLDVSNDDYHKQHGADVHYYSSSQLKVMLEDPELFYKTYITKEIGRKEIPAFAIGTYFHTAILEPEKLGEECAVWDGTRRGKAWDQFQIDNAGKAIVTKNELPKAMTLIDGYNNSEIAKQIYSGGQAELSLFVSYFVDLEAGEVYLDADSEWRLGLNGWEELPTRGCLQEEGLINMRVKVRADYLRRASGEMGGYIADLKSTTGNPRKQHTILEKIKSYVYDMSASLYLDAFNAFTIFDTGVSEFEGFYWSFGTKDFPLMQNYDCTQKMFQVGRAKYKKALLELAKYTKSGWVFEEEVISLDPPSWEDVWLKAPEKAQSKAKFTTTNINTDSLGEDLL